MPSQSLYRKWRSRTFGELIGQDHIKETLTNALRAGRISHAYLFCGPRGTGKTSTARLLAKAINCQNPHDGEPCNQCEMCTAIQDGRAMDLIEIDAASNRGIDEIRELRDKVGFAPSQAKYKFYILDEVHMLTPEAFNALLKTLEEPPGHAVFVLVTTEPHRIPQTITSRCQRFDFRRIRLKDLLSKLERICREEGLDIEPAALDLVARSATGSLRDAESLLDQLLAYGSERVTLDYVQNLLGVIPTESVARLVDHLVQRDTAAGLALINRVADEGADLRQYNREIVEYLHGLLLLKSGNSDWLNVTAEALEGMTAQAQSFELPDLIRVLRLFSQADQALRNSPQPQLPLELAFLDACTTEAARDASPGRAATRPESRLTAVPPSGGVGVAQPAPVYRAATVAASAPGPAQDGSERRGNDEPGVAAGSAGSEASAGGLELETVRRDWPAVLEATGQESRSLQGVLRDGDPVAVEGDVVVLGFMHAFHKERVDDPKNRVIVEKTLSRVLGRPSRVKCVLKDKGEASAGRLAATARGRREMAAQDPQVKAALEVFPGAEILEVP